MRYLRGRIGFWLFLAGMASAVVIMALAGGAKARTLGSSPMALALNQELFQPAFAATPSGEFRTVVVNGHPQGMSGPAIGPFQSGSGLFIRDGADASGREESRESLRDGKRRLPLSSERSDEEQERERCWEEHTVCKGETLIAIARQYPVGVKDILRANELDNPDRLDLGQKLFIPRSSDVIPRVIEERERIRQERERKQRRAEPLEMKEYTVQEGDSLWSIAGKFDLDINTLFGCNDLKNPDYLKPGVTLQIPNQDGILYKVEKGDTLSEIAKKYGTYAEAVLASNRFGEQRTLKKGEEIFLPRAKPHVSVFESGRGVPGGGSGFRWPMSSHSVSSGFGWRRDPFSGGRDFHTGIDITASRGAVIRASTAGRVAYAGWMGGYGRVVVLSHKSGYTSLYAHCQSLLVHKGQYVPRGKAIARVGTSGRSTGPHLHFEVRRNNSAINPKKVLQ
ncbi:MAG: LysM peptidoglycan-binding domain-containing M23 family metallopeptidase [Synergistales bacterium]|nr:LysM peptidoglycan-binding domain-containing M23 family metallopeptidase [Synergistales bacterium]